MGIFLGVVCSCEKAELLKEVERLQTLPQFFQINAAGDWGGGWGTLPNAEGEASAAAVGGLSEGVSFCCPLGGCYLRSRSWFGSTWPTAELPLLSLEYHP